MNNLAIFEEVAAGKLTPEQGTQRMLEADARAKVSLRPVWAPKWAWVVGGLAVAMLFAIIGIERRNS